MRLSGDGEQHGEDGEEKEEEEEGGGAVHVVHGAHDDQVEDDDEQVEQADHLHDEHAGLLGRGAGVHPGEDGRAQVGGRLQSATQVTQAGAHRRTHHATRALGAAGPVQRA